jgi:kynurenine formamidase
MSHPGGAASTVSYRHVVDLSHLIDPHISLWPGDPPIVLETVAELTRDGYHLRRFTMGEHSATHLNAPSSFHGVDEDEPFDVDRHVLAHGGIVLENLANLDQLPPTGTSLVIGILRLRHGTGSPAAVIAFVP